MRATALLLWTCACVSMRPASTEAIPATPERVARGEQLARGWGACLHCHSTPDENAWGTPPKPGTEWTGGTCWDEKVGFPGAVCSTNLTADPETGLGQWSDGEILRAVREGVSRDGRALFPIMPYRAFAKMSDEDAQAIVVFLRTLKPVKRAQPAAHLDFPVSLFIKMVPKPLDGPVSAPDRKDSVALGRYLAAPCQHCHTPVNGRGQAIEGKEFSGGQEFKFPWGGWVRSANLTPHATGLSNMTKDAFLNVFKGNAGTDVNRVEIEKERNTVMPWASYARMSDEELGAIYDYLRTLPKIENGVEEHPPRNATPAPEAR